MEKLQKKLDRAVEHKIIKTKNKKGMLDVFSNKFLSVGWNFVSPLCFCIFLGRFVSNKFAKSNIQIFMTFVMMGILLAFVNCYFFIKKIYFDER